MSTATPSTDAADIRPSFSHVLVMVLENQGYEDLIGSPDAPFVNDVLEKQTASATHFYTPYHNSPSDYYALASGKGYSRGDGGDWGGMCLPSIACSTSDVSVFEQLNDVGKSWKVYSEDQDRNCQIQNAKKYWVSHNPAVYYRNLGPNAYVTTGNGSCATSDVPYTELTTDLASDTLPELGFLVPNNCNNMHDKCLPVSNQIKQGDTWLRQQLVGDTAVAGGLIAWARAHNTLLVITFDEGRSTDHQVCCPHAATGGGGHIPTWVIGPPSKVREGGFQSVLEYSLYSILRAVEENFSLSLLGHAADPANPDLNDFLLPGIGLDPGPEPIPEPTATTYQETSPGIAYSGAWSEARYSGYLGKRVSWSSQRGASASMRFTGTSISWIGPVGPTRGEARIYVDGRFVRTVDMYSLHFVPSRVLYAASFTTERPRTLTIVVQGTRGRPIVALDALVVRSTPSMGASPTPTPSATPTGTPTPAATPTPSPTPSQ